MTRWSVKSIDCRIVTPTCRFCGSCYPMVCDVMGERVKTTPPLKTAPMSRGRRDVPGRGPTKVHDRERIDGRTRTMTINTSLVAEARPTTLHVDGKG